MEGPKGIALLAGMVLFVACAPYSRTSTSVATPAPSPALATRTDERPLERLVAYAVRSRSFDAERLTAEYAAARRAQRAAPGPQTRIRLAILLSHPNAPFRDDARARRLLGDAARARDAGLSDLARLLRRALEERADLERVLARERSRRHELERKLEQLMAIEQEIDRPDPDPVVPQNR